MASEKDSVHGALLVRVARAGAIIKEIREASGASIKILPPEDLPPCGLSNDRVVQCAPSLTCAPTCHVHMWVRCRSHGKMSGPCRAPAGASHADGSTW